MENIPGGEKPWVLDRSLMPGKGKQQEEEKIDEGKEGKKPRVLDRRPMRESVEKGAAARLKELTEVDRGSEKRGEEGEPRVLDRRPMREAADKRRAEELKKIIEEKLTNTNTNEKTGENDSFTKEGLLKRKFK